jgi:hypothetical protein
MVGSAGVIAVATDVEDAVVFVGFERMFTLEVAAGSVTLFVFAEFERMFTLEVGAGGVTVCLLALFEKITPAITTPIAMSPISPVQSGLMIT